MSKKAKRIISAAIAAGVISASAAVLLQKKAKKRNFQDAGEEHVPRLSTSTFAVSPTPRSSQSCGQ